MVATTTSSCLYNFCETIQRLVVASCEWESGMGEPKRTETKRIRSKEYIRAISSFVVVVRGASFLAGTHGLPSPRLGLTSLRGLTLSFHRLCCRLARECEKRSRFDSFNH
jgi:hypothetical protein